MAEELRLAELIQYLGEELVRAQQVAHDAPSPQSGFGLELKECSIEVGIVWQDATGSGLDFKVVTLDKEHSKSNTQTLCVTLKPTE